MIIKPATRVHTVYGGGWRFLGSRSPPMVFHPRYSVAWPQSHRFAMWKFDDLKAVLVDEGLVTDSELFVPRADTEDFEKAVRRAHDADYIQGFYSNTIDKKLWRRTGFTHRPDHTALVRRTRLEVAGTMLAADIARFYTGIALNLAGGTHHAHRSYGAGFTILNDLAITALDIAQTGGQVLCLDLDVHQGDGTAHICQHEPNVFTFSMHCADNYPFQFSSVLDYLGQDQSDLDVGLPSGATDADVFSALSSHLPFLLDTLSTRAKKSNENNIPPLCLYDAGIDVHVDDALGKFHCTTQGLFERDVYVLEQCLLRAIPVVTVIGGGYDRDRTKLANRHAIIVRAATHVWRKHFHTLIKSNFPQASLLSPASSILPHLETPQGLNVLLTQVYEEEANLGL